MKTRFVLFIVGLLIPLVMVYSGCTPARQTTTSPYPSIHFDQVTYNFGSIQKGQTTTYDFKFTNTGNGKLVINNVKPICGCTAALLSSKELLPGATGVIKVTFDSTNYLGPVTKTITVTDNDPEKPVVMLTIAGEVVTDIMADKIALVFGSIKKGERSQQTINFFISNPSVKITSVTSTKPYIKVSTLSQSISQETINVSVLPNAGFGPLNADIMIFSSSKKQPVLKIPVVGNISDIP